ncbi:hypothetical protein [Arthrobacter sp. H35-D1]|uniref:hypothetical protein n=1 Tax=Arthrobacter sp. H35-D1 TaxID=3046202 RepID=UPI0024BB4D0B|nr:hypothetical protein [Arthrobacter sp. H35-D1]MDJ0314035.1 hypothetical protein [Arthrobacter sp. H35-D1]
MPWTKRHHDDDTEIYSQTPASVDDRHVTMTTKPANPIVTQGDAAIVKHRAP